MNSGKNGGAMIEGDVETTIPAGRRPASVEQVHLHVFTTAHRSTVHRGGILTNPPPTSQPSRCPPQLATYGTCLLRRWLRLLPFGAAGPGESLVGAVEELG